MFGSFGKGATFNQLSGTGNSAIVSDRNERKFYENLIKRLIPRQPPNLEFDGAEFLKHTEFTYTDLSRTKYHRVDLSKLSFLHSEISRTKFIACKWGSGFENKKYVGREPKTTELFSFRCLRLLQDELNWRKATQREKKGEEDPTAGDIEVLALQLKQSLEATRDPIPAGDFHFSAMEMKRARAWKDKRYSRWATMGIYKVVNGYGERWGRALLWVFLTLIYFAFAYAGLESEFKVDSNLQANLGWWGRFGYGLVYSLQNLLPFKFSSSFLTVGNTTVYLLSMFETLFGTTLFTFFVLALRRRFKR